MHPGDNNTLVILTPGFPDGEEDSVCMPYVQMLLKALRKEYPSLSVHIISFQYPYAAKTFNWHGYTVHAMGGKNKKWNRLFTWHKAKKIFKSIHQSHKVRHIFSLWLTECTYIGQRLARQYNIPQVAWSVGQDVLKRNRYISLIDFSRLQTLCMSPFLKEQLLINHNIQANGILGNSIDVSGIPEPGNSAKTIDILSVGSFNHFKRFDWVVDCVNELKKTHSGIKACMIGYGPEYTNIRNKITQLGLEEYIELKGMLPHAECLELMKQSKLLLHPSSFEGGPTVALEALYYKCYVISVATPAENMPPTFFNVKTREEMTGKANEVLSLPDNESSYCVNSSATSAKTLMEALQTSLTTP